MNTVMTNCQTLVIGEDLSEVTQTFSNRSYGKLSNLPEAKCPNLLH